jgi:hypothetical protein
MIAALERTTRHGALPVLTALSTPPSIAILAEMGWGAGLIGAALAGCAALYLLCILTVAPPAEDMISRLMPSKAAYLASAAGLLGFGAYVGLGAG